MVQVLVNVGLRLHMLIRHSVDENGNNIIKR